MKYTPEQITAFARQAIAARDANDLRFVDLLLRLALRTGLQPLQVADRIEKLANRKTAA